MATQQITSAGGTRQLLPDPDPGWRIILVPLDGSALSQQALWVAEPLARRSGAAIHVITVDTVAPLIAGAPDTDDWRRSLIDTETDYLERMASSISSRGGVEARTALLHGEPHVRIHAYAEQSHADLIVMATHGSGGLKRAWLGSTTDAVIRASGIPVLTIVPRDAEGESGGEEPVAAGFRHVLVPLDGSTLAESVLPAASRLAGICQAELTLLRVVPPAYTIGSPYMPHTVTIDEEVDRRRFDEADRYLGSVAERLERQGARVRGAHTLVNVDPGRVILEQADVLEADVIAVATRGHGGIARTLLGSTADRVLRGARVPVLVSRVGR